MTHFFPGFFLVVLMIFVSCDTSNSENKNIIKKPPVERKANKSVIYKKEYIADSFDYPVGKPNAKGYYNAQKFGVNAHLGDDWNAVTGGNSDLGHPMYAVANGYVKFAEDIKGGWGKIIRIDHKLPDGQMVESFYAHCDEMFVQAGDWIKKGHKIGTIGNADGQYYAHLHFEMRSDTKLPIGGGYSENDEGYLDPTAFIKKHR